MPWASLTDLDGAHDVRVLDALAVPRFADEPSDGRLVLAEFLAEHLHRHDTMSGMLGAKHRGCPAFAHFATQGVSGDRLSNQVFFGHGANLTSALGAGSKRRLGESHGATPAGSCLHFLTKVQGVPI